MRSREYREILEKVTPKLSEIEMENWYAKFSGFPTVTSGYEIEIFTNEEYAAVQKFVRAHPEEFDTIFF